MEWVAGATRQIDFDESTLVLEAYRISTASSGGFGYRDLRDLDFKDYGALIDMILEDAKRE